MTSFVCLGDSIIKGDRVDSLRIGWVGRLQQILLKNTSEDWRIYNLGVDGNRISQIYQRFLSEALFRTPDVLAISAGFNDIVLDETTGNPALSLQERMRHWEPLLKKASLNVGETIVLSIQPVIEEKVVNKRLNKDVDTYNNEIKKCCDLYSNVHFLDLNTIFSKLNLEDYYGDALHPNDKGYSLIAGEMYKALKDIGISK